MSERKATYPTGAASGLRVEPSGDGTFKVVSFDATDSHPVHVGMSEDDAHDFAVAMAAAHVAHAPASVETYGVIWVCQDCILHHANGECGGCHEGHDEEPLSSIGDGFHAAMGMTHEEHAEDCLRRTQGGDAPDDYECGCAENTYSTSQCQGCGSYLHGERHAMTLFKG